MLVKKEAFKYKILTIHNSGKISYQYFFVKSGRFLTSSSFCWSALVPFELDDDSYSIENRHNSFEASSHHFNEISISLLGYKLLLLSGRPIRSQSHITYVWLAGQWKPSISKPTCDTDKLNSKFKVRFEEFSFIETMIFSRYLH